MPGSITLPQIVLDHEQEYKQLAQPPAIRSMVIRYGYMRMLAELPCEEHAPVSCGGKVVARTHRGIELGEKLTTTSNPKSCGKSITRKQLLEYVEASGGHDYPFNNQGKVLRYATPEDLQEQQRLDDQKPDIRAYAREQIAELDLPMKLVEIELLLGGERIIFHYTSEQWVDFRELVRQLAQQYQTRIEMHQVSARDEARLVADYEKCGQHCCCKQFLKVLKPVSMRSAKVQKATLDATKISGRCNRLMCCLRYEDQTYEQLRKQLPNRKARVMTEDGPGTVLDSQILTQLVLVMVDGQEQAVAYPNETLQRLSKEQDPQWQAREEARRKQPSDGPPARGGPRPQAGTRPPRESPPAGDPEGAGDSSASDDELDVEERIE